jgi:hypothetical protein
MTATAYHEAGHTAASLLLGVGVRRVSIIPRLERDGSCTAGFVSYFSRPVEGEKKLCPIRKSSHIKRRRRIENNIKISFAGRLAESRVLGVIPPASTVENDDLIIAYHLFLLSNHRNELNWRSRRLRLQTENLIECGWPLIETIADRLLASRYLTNAELRTIYGEEFRYGLNISR